MANAERYQKFEDKELILRDQLAIDRTKLSGDRTLLSFARTALTLFITGITALHLLNPSEILLRTLAWIFTLGGPSVFYIGLRQYRRLIQEMTREKDTLLKTKKLSLLNLPWMQSTYKRKQVAALLDESEAIH
jgi:putative membrane protein